MFNPFAILIFIEFAKREQKEHIKPHLHCNFCHNDTPQAAFNVINIIQMCPCRDVSSHAREAKFSLSLILMVGRLRSLGTFITLHEQNMNERHAAGLPAFDNKLEFKE